MKDFKKYSEERETGEKTETEERAERAQAEDVIGKMLSEYDGKSDVAMLSEIIRRAEIEKRAGRLSNEQIDAFYEQFSAALTPQQRKKLLTVVERLKKI